MVQEKNPFPPMPNDGEFERYAEEVLFLEEAMFAKKKNINRKNLHRVSEIIENLRNLDTKLVCERDASLIPEYVRYCEGIIAEFNNR